MTVLERAREAVQDATGLNARKAGDAVRAALTAIREPSDGMMTPFSYLESWQMPDTKGRWTAMVDHILNGGE